MIEEFLFFITRHFKEIIVTALVRKLVLGQSNMCKKRNYSDIIRNSLTSRHDTIDNTSAAVC